MLVNISFKSAKVYNIDQRVDVVLGEKFLISTDSTVPLAWFANQDSVLSFSEHDTSADVEATALGESTVLIMDANLSPIKKLIIKVVDAIVEPAASLNPVAEPAVLKQ